MGGRVVRRWPTAVNVNHRCHFSLCLWFGAEGYHVDAPRQLLQYPVWPKLSHWHAYRPLASLHLIINGGLAFFRCLSAC